MSTKRSAGPGVPTQENARSAATRKVGRLTATKKKDRSPNLCAFTFADGRQCRTPRRSGHLHLCYFHAQKEAESLAAQQVGEDISRFLPTKLLTACDLGVAMSRLFCAVARGEVKPKVASTLAYLAQTMLQSIPIAQDEYLNSFDTDTWRSTVRSSFRHEDPDDADDRANTDAAADDPAVAPAPQAVSQPPAQPAAVAHPGIHPDPVGRGEVSSSAPAPTQVASTPASNAPQPAPSPHTPLPPTSAEFAQHVMAGLNSSRSEIPTPPTPVEAGRNLSRPGREPGSSISPSSSSTAPAPSRTSSTQPAPSSPAPRPSPNNSQPAPNPPAPQSTSPQQSQPTMNQQHNSQPAPTPPAPSSVPPGFGAPANWDVLIPPKPRRRFSRHWPIL